MKKLLAAGIVLLLTAAAFAPASRAEEDLIGLAVATVDGQKDQTAAVEMTVDDPGGMDSLQFTLNYDPAALSLIEVIPGDLTKGGSLVYNTETSGVIQAAFTSALGLTEGGVFLSVRFKVLTDAGSAIVLTDALASRVDEAFEQTKAYVSVTDGGVRAGGAALPPGAVTPWPAETPVPTPTLAPTPTPSPTPFEIEQVVQQTPESTVTPAPQAPEDGGESGSAAPVLIAAGAALIVIAALIILLARYESRRKAQRRRSRRKDG